MHAGTMLLFLITVAYFPLLPVMPIFGLIGMVWSYGCEMWLLVRFYSRPPTLGSGLTKFFLILVPYALLVYVISGTIVIGTLVSGSGFLIYVGVGVFALAFVINLCTKRKCGKVIDVERREEDTYYNFVKDYRAIYSDYDIENPLTRDNGLERVRRYVQIQEGFNVLCFIVL